MTYFGKFKKIFLDFILFQLIAILEFYKKYRVKSINKDCSFIQHEIILKISEMLTNLNYLTQYFNTFKVVYAKLVAINKVTSALLVRYFW